MKKKKELLRLIIVRTELIIIRKDNY